MTALLQYLGDGWGGPVLAFAGMLAWLGLAAAMGAWLAWRSRGEGRR